MKQFAINRFFNVIHVYDHKDNHVSKEELECQRNDLTAVAWST